MNNASLSLASLEQLSWDANTKHVTIESPITDEVVSGSGSTSGGSTSDEQSGNDTYTGCFEG